MNVTRYPLVSIEYGEGSSTWVDCVACSPDGRSLAFGGSEKSVQIWDLVEEVVSTTFLGHGSCVRAVAWSPDGQSLASASDEVAVWDAHSGERRYGCVATPCQFSSVAWSPDGARLASGGMDGVVRVWDAYSGALTDELVSGEAHFAVIWAPHGRYVAAAAMDGTVKLWSV